MFSGDGCQQYSIFAASYSFACDEDDIPPNPSHFDLFSFSASLRCMGDWENTIPGLVYLQSRMVRRYDNVGNGDGESDATEENTFTTSTIRMVI